MLKFLSTIREEEYQEKSHDAAANGQRAPQEALHRRWHRTVRSGMSRGNSVFDPEDHVSAIVNFFFAPSGKSQQRLIVRIMDEDVLESILVRMFQHGAEGFHAVAAIVF